MKKFLTVICTALVIAVLAITVAGCSQSGKIKTAFKEAGYEITEVSAKDCDDLTNLLKTDEQKAEIGKYQVFTCKQFERTATVIIFPSEKVMEEVLGESTYKNKLDGGYVNGDCYLVKSCTDALYVFKNA